VSLEYAGAGDVGGLALVLIVGSTSPRFTVFVVVVGEDEPNGAAAMSRFRPPPPDEGRVPVPPGGDCGGVLGSIPALSLLLLLLLLLSFSGSGSSSVYAEE
jgi:hypothetical protein